MSDVSPLGNQEHDDEAAVYVISIAAELSKVAPTDSASL